MKPSAACAAATAPLYPLPVCLLFLLTLVRIQFGQSGVGVSPLVIQPFLPPAILLLFLRPFAPRIRAENRKP